MNELLTEIHRSIDDAGIVGYMIVGIGLMGLAIIIERAKALYFTYAVNTKEFMAHVKALVQNDQVEEAINHCAGKEQVPLVAVVKRVLERADRDDESIEKGQEIAVAEMMPVIGRRMGYLAMISNVATLLGLLGTVRGLIMAFAAVAKADPVQKQIILSQGISMAMYTTALGLAIAIPVMVAYSYLFARQNRHFEEIIECSSKVVDWLSTRHYQPFHVNNAYPTTDTGTPANGKKPPAPPASRLKAV